MNFSWKIFFSTISIAAVTFSIGSFYLIDSQFRSAFEREVTVAYEENYILCQTFLANKQMRDISDAYENMTSNLYTNYKTDLEITLDELKSDRREIIRQVAQSVNINTSYKAIPLRLCDSSYKTIYESIGFNPDKNMLKQISQNKKGYEVEVKENKYYIHTASPLTAQNEVLYLENVREITHLFTDRLSQYRTFYYMMFWLIFFSGIVVFAVSKWITLPLKKMSIAVKQIASGDFKMRLKVGSKDEIGRLSEDFNAMVMQLEQKMEELEEASRRQEDFVASFAHELKTPLTSIIGYADMLRSKQMEYEKSIICANYIFQEGRRLEALSMKLLEMIVLKKQKFKMKRIHTSEFFEEIKNAMFPIMQKYNIRLKMKVEDEIILIEPDLMKTVCMNLLDNARKAMNGGTIYFLGVKKSDCYTIAVCDTGKGMDESEIAKVTEAFYMVDKSRARAQGGAGLGLSICLEIVKLHNARMEIKSKPEKGTSIFIYLNEVE